MDFSKFDNEETPFLERKFEGFKVGEFAEFGTQLKYPTTFSIIFKPKYQAQWINLELDSTVKKER